jgi:hypothetical protein
MGGEVAPNEGAPGGDEGGESPRTGPIGPAPADPDPAQAEFGLEGEPS